MGGKRTLRLRRNDLPQEFISPTRARPSPGFVRRAWKLLASLAGSKRFTNATPGLRRRSGRRWIAPCRSRTSWTHRFGGASKRSALDAREVDRPPQPGRKLPPARAGSRSPRCDPGAASQGRRMRCSSRTTGAGRRRRRLGHVDHRIRHAGREVSLQPASASGTTVSRRLFARHGKRHLPRRGQTLRHPD